MKYFNAPFEIKTLDDVGTFDGYASIFGNVDQGGDVIERGAFKEFAKNDMGEVTVLWQHQTGTPIGVARVSEDHKGLHFEGKLVLEDPNARRAQAHMKAKSVRGMSIGYDVLAGGAKILDSGVRTLSALKLWEISVVTFGMNDLARVEGVKASQQITNVRDYEDFLRDAGFSISQSKTLARAYLDLPGQRDAGGKVQVNPEFMKFLASVSTPS